MKYCFVLVFVKGLVRKDFIVLIMIQDLVTVHCPSYKGLQGATRDFRDQWAFKGTGTLRAFWRTKKGAFRALYYKNGNELSQELNYFYLFI